MNANFVRSSYLQIDGRSASPVGLVVLLHDTAIRSLHRALHALKINDVEQRTAELNHVLAVIGQLQGVLNFEHGGDVAPQLDRFYDHARGKVMEAQIKVSEPIMRQLAEEFLSLRESWQQVEREVSGAPAPAPAHTVARSIAAQPGSVPVEEPVGSHWSA